MRDSCLETCRRPSFFPHENRKSSGPRLFTWNQRHPITAFSPCLRQKGTQQMQKKDQITQELFSVITEPSTIQGIKETLKLCMDSLKDNTLNTLLKQDADYQTALLEYRQAHQRYQNTDFTESQREVIDTLLARKDESEFEHTANAYMAGLLDSYRILRNFGLTNE